jgi:hypothetical protein
MLPAPEELKHVDRLRPEFRACCQHRVTRSANGAGASGGISGRLPSMIALQMAYGDVPRRGDCPVRTSYVTMARAKTSTGQE